MSDKSADAYWQASVKLILTCLAVWFVVSYGFGIILRDALDAIQVGGAGLGFWFAQQGSIYIFVALIFFYAARMNKMDREFDVDEE